MADTQLNALTAATAATGGIIYGEQSGASRKFTLTSFGAILAEAASAAAQRTALGLVIGTNVQAYDADLTTWAGVTPGTGVATALAVNVGSAGAVVLNGGALGTPSSGTLTSCTGLPIATGVSGLGTGVATALAAGATATGGSAAADGKIVLFNSYGGINQGASFWTWYQIVLGDDLADLRMGTSYDVCFARAAARTLKIYDILGNGAMSIRIMGDGTKYTTIGHDGTDAILSASSGNVKISSVVNPSAGTRINTATYAGNQTLSGAEVYGGTIYVTAAATITLPAVAAGMSVTVITIGAVAVSVDPNAADRMYLDGVLLDDGDKATNLSTTGDIITLTYYSADGWYATSNGWTDGGA